MAEALNLQERDEDRFLRELNRIRAEQDPNEGENVSAWDPSVTATRKMLQMCQQAEGVGLRTVVVLDQQGEQLDNVGNALNTVARDLDSAERDLSQMQRPLCCPWRCLWKRKRQKSSPGFLSATVPPSKKGSSSSTSSLTNDRRPETSERKEHTDDVSKAVADLKDVAQSMGHELSSQNEQIVALTASASSSSERVRRASEKAEELLRDG